MELLKFFIKDEVPAVGLSKFKGERKRGNYQVPQKLNLSHPAFKPNYNNNFFLL